MTMNNKVFKQLYTMENVNETEFPTGIHTEFDICFGDVITDAKGTLVPINQENNANITAAFTSIPIFLNGFITIHMNLSNAIPSVNKVEISVDIDVIAATLHIIEDFQYRDTYM